MRWSRKWASCANCRTQLRALATRGSWPGSSGCAAPGKRAIACKRGGWGRCCTHSNPGLMHLWLKTMHDWPLQELRRAYDDERRANDDLARDADRDRQTIDDLKAR